MKSLRWWLGLGPTPLVVSALICLWALLDLAANRELENHITRLRGQGVPIRLVQIPQPEIPEDRNAAPLYAEAAALAAPISRDSFSAAGLRTPWSIRPAPIFEQPARQWVVRNRRPLELLLRADAMPECRQRVDLEAWRLGSSRVFDSFHLLGILEAATRVAHWDGDDERVDRLFAAGLRLQRSHTGAPGLYEMWTRVLEFQVAIDRCLDAMNDGFIPGPLLRKAIQDLPSGRCQSELAGALREEQILFLEEALGGRMDHGRNLPRSGIQALVWKVARPFTIRNIAHGLSTSERLREAGSKPAEELLHLTAFLELEHLGRLPSNIDICNSIFGNVRRVLTADLYAQVLRAALEGLGSRDAEGVWPDTWPALDSLRNPATGEPLSRRREGRVLVVTLAERWSGPGYWMPEVEVKFSPFAGK